MRGTIEDIYMEAKECIVKGHNSKKGFVLSTGCDVPIGTDPEKIVALMDAARIFGSRNININEL